MVVGDVMTDVVVRPAAPLAPGSDTPARIELRSGGSAANAAAWLAVAGSAPAYVGRVGNDPFGRAGIAELGAYGVDVRAQVDPRRPTGTCVVLVSPDGERSMLPDRGANDALDAADLPEDLFAGRGHLHLSGYALLGEGSRGAALRALDLARSSGTTISVDASSAAPLAAAGVDRFLQWVTGADLLFVNEDEAAALGGPGALAAGGRQVVVKLGAGGATWRCGPDEVRVASVPATVIDTTGAGDAFAAGFLPAWLSGAAPRDALAAGCALGARAVGRVGGRPPLPRPPEG